MKACSYELLFIFIGPLFGDENIMAILSGARSVSFHHPAHRAPGLFSVGH